MGTAGGQVAGSSCCFSSCLGSPRPPRKNSVHVFPENLELGHAFEYKLRVPEEAQFQGLSGATLVANASSDEPNPLTPEPRWKEPLSSSAAMPGSKFFLSSVELLDIKKKGSSNNLQSKAEVSHQPHGLAEGEDTFLGVRGQAGVDWAQAAAGEDRLQVIVSEEQGWAYIAVYDGFSGSAVSEFLSKHLFAAIEKRLHVYLHGKAALQPDRGAEPAEVAGAAEVAGSKDAQARGGEREYASGSGERGGPTEGEERPLHRWVMGEMEAALMEVEEQFLANLAASDDKALMTVAMVGSCVLASLIKGKDLFVMNVGDSRALLSSVKPPSSGASSRQDSSRDAERGDAAVDDLVDSTGVWPPGWRPCENLRMANFYRLFGSPEWPSNETSVSNGHNGHNPRLRALFYSGSKVGHLETTQLTVDHVLTEALERKRVVDEHLDDANVIHKERIKGKLKVTRAAGAGFLKKPELNDRLSLGYFRVNYVGKQPYIISTPTLRYRRLTAADRFLVFSSDGLFQYFSNQQALEFVQWLMVNQPHVRPAHGLVAELYRRAAQTHDLSVQELSQIPLGEGRRDVHDDVSVVVFSLV